MNGAVLRVGGLPDEALDAAAAFYDQWLPRALKQLSPDSEVLTIVLSGAAYDHTDWRRAAARDIARAAAPQRVNIVAGDDEGAIAATVEYLARAPGVTGQYLPTTGGGAGVATG